MTNQRRARLQLASAKKPQGSTFAQIKKAIRLYRGRGVPREVMKANVRKWLFAMEQLGDKHTLHRSKPEAKWGLPGTPIVKQIRAPRRLGESA